MKHAKVLIIGAGVAGAFFLSKTKASAAGLIRPPVGGGGGGTAGKSAATTAPKSPQGTNLATQGGKATAASVPSVQGFGAGLGAGLGSSVGGFLQKLFPKTTAAPGQPTPQQPKGGSSAPSIGMGPGGGGAVAPGTSPRAAAPKPAPKPAKTGGMMIPGQGAGAGNFLTPIPPIIPDAIAAIPGLDINQFATGDYLSPTLPDVIAAIPQSDWSTWMPGDSVFLEPPPDLIAAIPAIDETGLFDPDGPALGFDWNRGDYLDPGPAPDVIAEIPDQGWDFGGGAGAFDWGFSEPSNDWPGANQGDVIAGIPEIDIIGSGVGAIDNGFGYDSDYWDYGQGWYDQHADPGSYGGGPDAGYDEYM